MGKKKSASAVSNLVLVQSAWPNVVQGRSASNILNITDSTDMQHKIKLATNALTLSDEALTQNILYLNASNTLNLTHSAERRGTLNINVENQLNLTHNAYSALHIKSIDHQLELQQTVDVRRPIHLEAFNELSAAQADLIELTETEQKALKTIVGLRHSVTLIKSIYNVSAINYLSLSQQAAKTILASASNHIELSHFARKVLYETPISYLNLQQVASCTVTQPVSNILNLTQSVSVIGVVSRAVSSQLFLRDVCSYFIVNFCDYTPGIGAGTFDYTPPSIIPPILIRRTTTILTWPYTLPVLTLTLRNSDMDNIEQFNNQRINRKTLGNQLDLFRDETWPKIQRLIYNFSALTGVQRRELFDFFIKSIGQEIGILDFESRQWRGIIITPSSAISETLRECGNRVSLEFEGLLV